MSMKSTCHTCIFVYKVTIYSKLQIFVLCFLRDKKTLIFDLLVF